MRIITIPLLILITLFFTGCENMTVEEMESKINFCQKMELEWEYQPENEMCWEHVRCIE